MVTHGQTDTRRVAVSLNTLRIEWCRYWSESFNDQRSSATAGRCDWSLR